MGQSLLALKVEEFGSHEALVKALGPKLVVELCRTWEAIARPEQLQPKGDWSAWTVLAGRGWGKTRTGAEWCKGEVTAGRAKRLALVAPTASDSRDVMIEGESGILSLYAHLPDEQRPLYEPSKRRITWPNGAIATTYTAEEPNRLRGPQHDCFVAGTMVQCDTGSMPIERVKIGQHVFTRNGLRRVIDARSSIAALATLTLWNGTQLTGTIDHPILTPSGWKPLAQLVAGDNVYLWANDGSARFRDISTATNEASRSTGIGSFGLRQTAPSRQAITSTMRMESRATTGSETCDSSLRSLIKTTTPFLPSGRHAPSAGSSSTGRPMHGRTPPRFVACDAETRSESGPGSARSAPVSTVGPSSSLGGGTTVVSGVSILGDVGRVYNLTVDEAPEYFANGVLVHNCFWADEIAAWKYPQETWDQLQFGLRLGAKPRGIITTTPRPIPLVRALIADPSVSVTRGVTYDNADHLAPSFLEAIKRAYEGTRLGRQEIFAEVLDDNPGALWRAAQIEAARVRVAPGMRRVVIGVDPAGSSNAESDETGIIIAGVGNCSCTGKQELHVFVTDDLSGIFTPDGWAKVVAKGYHERSCDRVVVEKNFGGDLVMSNLRTLGDTKLSIRPVTASRGKAIRAEPVAALYEQGKVHHVGGFSKLEDQLTQWNPLADKKSPDRLDALVWAITDLVLAPSSSLTPLIIGGHRRY